jgi:ABC-type multidrug transport system ATPase subunit
VSPAPVITVSDLVKSYGQVEAVRGIGLEAKPGETFGFLEPMAPRVAALPG